jgi:hypothetical protein
MPIAIATVSEAIPGKRTLEAASPAGRFLFAREAAGWQRLSGLLNQVAHVAFKFFHA